MNEPLSFELSWEGTDNPNDPSGVARLSVGLESIALPMNDWAHAAKLCKLIEKACEWEKQNAIHRAMQQKPEPFRKPNDPWEWHHISYRANSPF
jgi:hypothetical protein